MISDVVSDVEFLYKERKIRNFESSMKIDDIFYNCKNKKYWLGNWMNISFENLIVISYEDNSNNEPLASLDISEELSGLGMILKELTGITHPDGQAGRLENRKFDFKINEQRSTTATNNKRTERNDFV